MADAGSVKSVETENGVYTVETKTDGYHIEKEGEENSAVDLVYNAEDNSWNVEANGEAHKLLKYGNDNNVVMYLPDGLEMNVELSQAGTLAFQQVAQGYAYYAAR